MRRQQAMKPVWKGWIHSSLERRLRCFQGSQKLGGLKLLLAAEQILICIQCYFAQCQSCQFFCLSEVRHTGQGRAEVCSNVRV